jgi:hypothetical protein
MLLKHEDFYNYLDPSIEGALSYFGKNYIGNMSIGEHQKFQTKKSLFDF